MRASIAAIFLFLAASRAGAVDGAAEACRAGWQEKYASDWGLVHEDWDALCASGKDPVENLHRAQAAFIKECVARFEKTAASGMPAALCAQGKQGEQRLREMTGVPAEAAEPKEAVPIVTAGLVLAPGNSDTGPFMPALRAARSRWKDDACWSGLHYGYTKSVYISAAEWERARREHRPERQESASIEQYNYAFISPTAGPTGYRVSYGDHIESVFCSEIERLKGPEAEPGRVMEGFAGCLRDVSVGLAKAIVTAGFHAGPAEANLSADLVTLPRGYFKEKSGLTAGQLRRITGVEVWMVSSGGRTAFVDAGSGRLLAESSRALVMNEAPTSILEGVICGMAPAH